MPWKLPARDAQREVVQHGAPRLVGEVEVLDRDVAAAHAPLVAGHRRLRLGQQRLHARGADQGLLQLRELHRDLDQRLHHARDVADEGIQHADLRRAQRAAAGAQPEHAQHHGQQQHVEEVQHRPQQPGVGAQLAPARAVVRLVERVEARAKARRRIGGLQHAACRRSTPPPARSVRCAARACASRPAPRAAGTAPRSAPPPAPAQRRSASAATAATASPPSRRPG